MWWVQPMGGSRLLYFLSAKLEQNFGLLCFNVNTCILLCFLRWQEVGATAPLAIPLNPPLVCNHCLDGVSNKNPNALQRKILHCMNFLILMELNSE